jgi:hypothetical protein
VFCEETFFCLLRVISVMSLMEEVSVETSYIVVSEFFLDSVCF